MAPQPRGQPSGGGLQEVGQTVREIGQLLGEEGGNVGEEHGTVAEVLGNRRVGGDAADRREAEGGLLVEEVKGGVELGVYEGEFGDVALRVGFHL